MKVVNYNPLIHYPHLVVWGRERGVEIPPLEYFSDIGLVVEGVGAAFLYTTNSKQCILDNIVINPRASFEDRAQAGLLITEGLCQKARELGYWLIIGQAEGQTMIKRALASGFEVFKSFTMVRKFLNAGGA